MKKALVGIIWVIVIGSVGYFVYRGFIRPPAQKTTAPSEEKAIPVEYIAVKKGTIAEALALTGEIKPESEVRVESKITGRVEALRLKDGTPITEGVHVKKGQQIAVIDHDALEAAFHQSEAAVNVARASLDRAKVSVEDTRREKERAESLFKKKVLSQENYDRKHFAYKRALAEEALAQAQLKQTQANLETARINLRESIIRAPLDGVVSQKFVEEGDMVTLRTPLVSILSDKVVKVIVGVPEKFLMRLKPHNTPVRIRVDAHPGRTFPATIALIYPTVDRLTRTAQVEIRVNNKEGLLKSGMFARVIFILEEHHDTPIVPRDCVLGRNSDRYVYTISGGRTHKIPVTIGITEGDRREIISGLKEGDRLVITGMEYLRDGARVIAVAKEGKE